MLPEELEGQVGVGDDRASLLSDCLVYHAGAFDVACLSFAYSEDGCDALDSMHEAWGVVCRQASAAEGFLYGLVDYLCELSYGEVNDSSVLIYHVFRCLLGPRRRSRTARPLHRSVFAVTRARLLLQRPGLGGACAPLCFVFVCSVASRRWLVILSLWPGTRQDPLKNSSGLLAPSVGVSLPRVGPRGSLSFRRYPAGARSVLQL